MPPFRLDGKRALVTGGTKGLGAAIVRSLATAGAKVHLCARTRADVDAAVRAWHSDGLTAISGSACDVTDPDARAALLRDVRARFDGELDILVSNVGFNIRKPTTAFTAKEYRALMDANLEASFALCQVGLAVCPPIKWRRASRVSPTDSIASYPRCVIMHPRPLDVPRQRADAPNRSIVVVRAPRQIFHPLLRAAGSSAVVFNSSVASLVSMQSGAVYAMTKGAMNILTKYLACEWARDGVRVNAVAPWYINTPLARAVLKDERYKKHVVDATPAARVGEPREVGDVVAFLCMDEASYVTGQVLAIDGGFSVNGWKPPAAKL